MKKSVLTIALAIATALIFSPPAAFAKKHSQTTKTSMAKKTHKKHWYK